MRIVVEKFPDIEFQGGPLVWDSRQTSRSGEWVVVHLDQHEKRDVRAVLLARPGAKFIGPPGSGLDLEVGDTRRFIGLAAAAHFGMPSRDLKLFGITGTNGKTTCATLVRAQLTARGLRVAELGTLGLRVFEAGTGKLLHAAETGFTTAEAPTLQNLLRQFITNGIAACVMEASSHGASLARVAGCDFDGLLYTNLTQDHLDFHGTMDAYEEAKASLFTEYLPRVARPAELALFPTLATSQKKRIVSINVADAAGARLVERLEHTIDVRSYAIGKSFTIESSDTRGNRVRLERGTTLSSPLIGDFNAENLVGSFELLDACGLGSADALVSFQGAAGRMERVSEVDQPAVFVDYAHTPDALSKALATLRRVLPPGGRLVCAFGCGGDRDAGKRPIMGAIAAQLADLVVLCSDNPRTEDPMTILSQIEAGIAASLRAKVTVEENRARAIAAAVAMLDRTRGDALLIAGKGHEEYQIVGTTKHAFSDAATARAALAVVKITP